MALPFRQKKYNPKHLYALLTALLLVIAGHAATAGEGSLYGKILSLHRAGNHTAVLKKGAYFLKKYPRSSRVADVRFYMAENDTDVSGSLSRFQVIIKNYRYFRKNDFVSFRICQIYFLRSDWKNLHAAAEAALQRYPRSPLKSEFLLMAAHSAVKSGNLSRGEKLCRELQKNDHRYHYMARSLFLLASIARKKSGYSRSYIYALREILKGFTKSEVYPSALFLTGEFYLHHGDNNRAFSAFSDLVEKYPRALESFEARKHLKELKKGNPKRSPYVPDQKILEKTDSIDISPERPLPDKNTGTCYSVAVGPLHTLGDSNRIYRLIKPYGSIKSFRTRYGYTHYIGCFPSTRGALALKVRLAEEMGINGTIARIDASGRGNYIYGEEK